MNALSRKVSTRWSEVYAKHGDVPRLVQVCCGERYEQDHVRNRDDASNGARLDRVVNQLRDQAVGLRPRRLCAAFRELHTG